MDQSTELRGGSSEKKKRGSRELEALLASTSYAPTSRRAARGAPQESERGVSGSAKKGVQGKAEARTEAQPLSPGKSKKEAQGTPRDMATQEAGKSTPKSAGAAEGKQKTDAALVRSNSGGAKQARAQKVVRKGERVQPRRRGKPGAGGVQEEEEEEGREETEKEEEGEPESDEEEGEEGDEGDVEEDEEEGGEGKGEGAEEADEVEAPSSSGRRGRGGRASVKAPPKATAPKSGSQRALFQAQTPPNKPGAQGAAKPRGPTPDSPELRSGKQKTRPVNEVQAVEERAASKNDAPPQNQLQAKAKNQVQATPKKGAKAQAQAVPKAQAQKKGAGAVASSARAGAVSVRRAPPRGQAGPPRQEVGKGSKKAKDGTGLREQAARKGQAKRKGQAAQEQGGAEGEEEEEDESGEEGEEEEDVEEGEEGEEKEGEEEDDDEEEEDEEEEGEEDDDEEEEDSEEEGSEAEADVREDGNPSVGGKSPAKARAGPPLASPAAPGRGSSARARREERESTPVVEELATDEWWERHMQGEGEDVPSPPPRPRKGSAIPGYPASPAPEESSEESAEDSEEEGEEGGGVEALAKTGSGGQAAGAPGTPIGSEWQDRSGIVAELVAASSSREELERRILKKAATIRRMRRECESASAAAKRAGKHLVVGSEGSEEKTHWDHLLEEVAWMAKDFERERKWRVGQAKRTAGRALRQLQEFVSRHERKEKEEESRIRKVASGMAKDVRRFWSKIEKLVLYKHQLEVEEKKKKAMDKHLDFLLGQTERYSSMLAENLAAGGDSKGTGRERGLKQETGEEGDGEEDEEEEGEEEEEEEGEEGEREEEEEGGEEGEEGQGVEEVDGLEEEVGERDGEGEETVAGEGAVDTAEDQKRTQATAQDTDTNETARDKAAEGQRSAAPGVGRSATDSSLGVKQEEAGAVPVTVSLKAEPHEGEGPARDPLAGAKGSREKDGAVQAADGEEGEGAAGLCDLEGEEGAVKEEALEDEFVPTAEALDEEDDEATLDEEERMLAEQGEDGARGAQDDKDEVERLQKESEMSVEELLAKYKEQASQNGDMGDTSEGEESEEEEEEGGSEGDAAEAEGEEGEEEAGESGAEAAGESGAEAAGDGDVDMDDFVPSVDALAEEDDEATLEEEEQLVQEDGAPAEGGADDEVERLQKESEMSVEELLAKYKEQATQQDGADGEEGEEEEGGPAGEGEAGRKERLESAALAAMSAQPTGNTLSTTSVRTKVPFLLKHSLREYQHIGLDWLVTMYEKRLNGILADEMGLGKTIMAIALLAWLACEKGIWGPHLVVVPTSVMLNWEMELLKWCPAFKVLTYFGGAKERKAKRAGWSKPNSFHVCITTYRLIIQDAKAFRRKKWKYLILDEAHLIKNWKSQRWQTLLNFNSKRRILITGTPLQNDLMELWSLMHFLMPHVFQSHTEFRDWFCNPIAGLVEGTPAPGQSGPREGPDGLKVEGEGGAEAGPEAGGGGPAGAANQEVVSRLHNVLRPFLLRRLKSDVEKQLPPKFEHIVRCRLSKRQRQLYEDFMASSEVQATLNSGNFIGLLNVLMQLRKVCNHPDLFEGRAIVSSFDMLPPLELRYPSPALYAAFSYAHSLSRLLQHDHPPTPAPAPATQAPQAPEQLSVVSTAGHTLGEAGWESALVNGGASGDENEVWLGFGGRGFVGERRRVGQGRMREFLGSRGLLIGEVNFQLAKWEAQEGARLAAPPRLVREMLGGKGAEEAQASSRPWWETLGGLKERATREPTEEGDEEEDDDEEEEEEEEEAEEFGGAGEEGAGGGGVLDVAAAANGPLPGLTAPGAAGAAQKRSGSKSKGAAAGLLGGSVRKRVNAELKRMWRSMVREAEESGTWSLVEQAQREGRAGAAAQRRARAAALESQSSLRCGLWGAQRYGRDLINLVTLRPTPARPLLGAAASPPLRDAFDGFVTEAVPPTELRCAALLPLVTTFLFRIPKARGRAPSAWCSHPPPTEAVHQQALGQELAHLGSPLLAPLRPAQVRQQLFFPDRRLIQFDCGKLQELAELLRRLRAEGHRALIFTQMTRMLDVLENFLALYGHTYLRLDGTTKPEQRQVLVQRFNQPSSKVFLFILSTRSGGVGINLTGADTVIFYDSDWNPAMDQQAQDRCHRIGQTREVHIYRFVTESTIEENILRKAEQKRALDDLVIQSAYYNTEFFQKLDPMELFSGLPAAKQASAAPAQPNGAGEAAAPGGGAEGGAPGAQSQSQAERGAGAGGGAGSGVGVGPREAAEVERAMRAVEDEADGDARRQEEEAAKAEEQEFALEDALPSMPAGGPGAVAGAAPEGEGEGEEEEEEEEGEGDDATLPASADHLGRGGAAPGVPESAAPGSQGGGLSSLPLRQGQGQGEVGLLPGPLGAEEEEDMDMMADARQMAAAAAAAGTSASSFGDQLRPIERYAMRFYEEWDPVVRAREGEEEVEFSEEEWELERLEKLKEEQEAEVDEDDEPHFFESWDQDAADEAYRQQVEVLAQQQEEFRRQEWEMLQSEMAAVLAAKEAADAAEAEETHAQREQRRREKKERKKLRALHAAGQALSSPEAGGGALGKAGKAARRAMWEEERRHRRRLLLGGEVAEGAARPGGDGSRRGAKRRLGEMGEGEEFESEFEDEDLTSEDDEEGSEAEGEVDFLDLGGYLGRGRGEESEGAGEGVGGEEEEEEREEEADAAEEAGVFQSYGLTWLWEDSVLGTGTADWDQAEALWATATLPAAEDGDASGLLGLEGEDGVPSEVGIAHRHSNWEAFRSSMQGGSLEQGPRRGLEGPPLFGSSGGKLAAAFETQQAQLLLSMQLQRMHRQRKLQGAPPAPAGTTPLSQTPSELPPSPQAAAETPSVYLREPPRGNLFAPESSAEEWGEGASGPPLWVLRVFVRRPRYTRVLTALSSLLPHLPRAEGLSDGGPLLASAYPSNVGVQYEVYPVPATGVPVLSVEIRPKKTQKALALGGATGPGTGPGVKGMEASDGTRREGPILGVQPEEGRGTERHMWTPLEDALLCTLALHYGPNWALVADALSLCIRAGSLPTLNLHSPSPVLLHTNAERPGFSAQGQGAPQGAAVAAKGGGGLSEGVPGAGAVMQEGVQLRHWGEEGAGSRPWLASPLECFLRLHTLLVSYALHSRLGPASADVAPLAAADLESTAGPEQEAEADWWMTGDRLEGAPGLRQSLGGMRPSNMRKWCRRVAVDQDSVVELLQLLLRIPRPVGRGVSQAPGAPTDRPRGRSTQAAVTRWKAFARAQRRVRKQAQESVEKEAWPAVYLLSGGEGAIAQATPSVCLVSRADPVASAPGAPSLHIPEGGVSKTEPESGSQPPGKPWRDFLGSQLGLGLFRPGSFGASSAAASLLAKALDREEGSQAGAGPNAEAGRAAEGAGGVEKGSGEEGGAGDGGHEVGGAAGDEEGKGEEGEWEEEEAKDPQSFLVEDWLCGEGTPGEEILPAPHSVGLHMGVPLDSVPEAQRGRKRGPAAEAAASSASELGPSVKRRKGAPRAPEAPVVGSPEPLREATRAVTPLGAASRVREGRNGAGEGALLGGALRAAGAPCALERAKFADQYSSLQQWAAHTFPWHRTRAADAGEESEEEEEQEEGREESEEEEGEGGAPRGKGRGAREGQGKGERESDSPTSSDLPLGQNAGTASDEDEAEQPIGSLSIAAQFSAQRKNTASQHPPHPATAGHYQTPSLALPQIHGQPPSGNPLQPQSLYQLHLQQQQQQQQLRLQQHHQQQMLRQQHEARQRNEAGPANLAAHGQSAQPQPGKHKKVPPSVQPGFQSQDTWKAKHPKPAPASALGGTPGGHTTHQQAGRGALLGYARGTPSGVVLLPDQAARSSPLPLPLGAPQTTPGRAAGSISVGPLHAGQVGPGRTGLAPKRQKVGGAGRGAGVAPGGVPVQSRQHLGQAYALTHGQGQGQGQAYSLVLGQGQAQVPGHVQGQSQGPSLQQQMGAWPAGHPGQQQRGTQQGSQARSLAPGHQQQAGHYTLHPQSQAQTQSQSHAQTHQPQEPGRAPLPNQQQQQHSRMLPAAARHAAQAQARAGAAHPGGSSALPHSGPQASGLSQEHLPATHGTAFADWQRGSPAPAAQAAPGYTGGAPALAGAGTPSAWRGGGLSAKKAAMKEDARADRGLAQGGVAHRRAEGAYALDLNVSNAGADEPAVAGHSHAYSDSHNHNYSHSHSHRGLDLNSEAPDAPTLGSNGAGAVDLNAPPAPTHDPQGLPLPPPPPRQTSGTPVLHHQQHHHHHQQLQQQQQQRPYGVGGEQLSHTVYRDSMASTSATHSQGQYQYPQQQPQQQHIGRPGVYHYSPAPGDPAQAAHPLIHYSQPGASGQAGGPLPGPEVHQRQTEYAPPHRGVPEGAAGGVPVRQLEAPHMQGGGGPPAGGSPARPGDPRHGPLLTRRYTPN